MLREDFFFFLIINMGTTTSTTESPTSKKPQQTSNNTSLEPSQPKRATEPDEKFMKFLGEKVKRIKFRNRKNLDEEIYLDDKGNYKHIIQTNQGNYNDCDVYTKFHEGIAKFVNNNTKIQFKGSGTDKHEDYFKDTVYRDKAYTNNITLSIENLNNGEKWESKKMFWITMNNYFSCMSHFQHFQK